MAVFGGQNYTGFQAVNIKGSVMLRYGGFDTNQGTLSIAPASLEANRAWGLPDKSGTFGVTGTLAVQVPAITANNFLSTTVTVTGLRVEDGFVANLQTNQTINGTRGVLNLLSAQPGNGNVALLFAEVVGTATIYQEHVIGYTTVR